MAESLKDAVARLSPSRSQFPFFNNVVLVDKANAPLESEKNSLNGTDFTLNVSCLLFPAEFPYELDSAFSIPNSTLTDEQDFLAGLTQRLTHSSTRKTEKSWVVSGSPEWTLSGLGSMGSSNGSSSLVSSPPTTPFCGENDTWDLISAAAGQVARLKMSNATESGTSPKYTTANGHARGGLLLAPPRRSSPLHVANKSDIGFYTSHSVHFDQLAANTNQSHEYTRPEQMLKTQSQRQQLITWASSQPQQIHNEARNNYVYENVRCGQQQQDVSQTAWRPLQKPQQQLPVFVAGSGNAKRVCTGTGLFLPRVNGNTPHDSGRRSVSGCPDPEGMTEGLVQQRFDCSFGPNPNYDAMMIARRNAAISLPTRFSRQEGARIHEIHLPKEWTY